MELIWGVIVVVLGLLAWGGQALAWLSPRTAARLGLAEAEGTVEDVYWADGRGEALWDMATLWTLPLAGVLLIGDQPAWAYLGLVGGGMYTYFAGRGVLTRLELRRRGFRIGSPANVQLALVMLAVWGAAGLVTMGAAVVALG